MASGENLPAVRLRQSVTLEVCAEDEMNEEGVSDSSSLFWFGSLQFVKGFEFSPPKIV
jgi:hypothetical protein